MSEHWDPVSMHGATVEEAFNGMLHLLEQLAERGTSC